MSWTKKEIEQFEKEKKEAERNIPPVSEADKKRGEIKLRSAGTGRPITKTK